MDAGSSLHLKPGLDANNIDDDKINITVTSFFKMISTDPKENGYYVKLNDFQGNCNNKPEATVLIDGNDKM